MRPLKQQAGHGARLPLDQQRRPRGLQRHCGQARQRIIHPDRQPQRQPRDHHGFMFPRRCRAGHHRHIGLAPSQIGQQAPGIANAGGDFHLWMRRGKPGQQRHGEGRAGKPQHQPPAPQRRQVPRRPRKLIHPRQREPRPHQQGPPVLGQFQPPAPMQQPQATRLLKVVHLRRHAWLRQPQHLRGGREAPGLYHRHKGPQRRHRNAALPAAWNVRIHQTATRKFVLLGYRSSPFPM